MKTLTLFVSFAIFCVFFSSCGSKSSNQNQQTQTPQTNNNTSTQNNNTSQTASGSSTEAMTDKLIMLEFDKKKIPSSAKYKGNVVAGSRWLDKNGENLLIVTETDEQIANADSDRLLSKELFAYCYLIDGDKATLLWDINDFIKDCPLDMKLEYIPSSVSVTDLNTNGIAENTFLYRMSCKGDVSPDALKLMMHEGNTKYAQRGETQIEFEIEGQKQIEGGKGTPDASFKSAPDGFLKYAQEQWDKFKVQKP